MTDDIFSARFFDGKQINAHIASVSITPEGLTISYPDNGSQINVAWPKKSLKVMERFYQAKPAVIGSNTMLGARLIIENQSDYKRILPLVSSRQIKLGHIAHPWRIFWISLVLILVLIGTIAVHMPKTAVFIANFIPQKWENMIWENLSKPNELNHTQCVAPEGVAALNKLVSRILPETSPDYHAMDIRVIDSPVVNAYTLPGYHIFIYQGLIKEAIAPDEVAGVIAHEMGHAIKHHTTAILINHFGLKAFLSAIIKPSADLTHELLVLKYRRDYERQADDIAAQLLHQANINTDGFLHFFETMKKQGSIEGLETYFADHPTDEERLKSISEKERTAHPVPSLTEKEWKALRSICDKKAKIKF